MPAIVLRQPNAFTVERHRTLVERQWQAQRVELATLTGRFHAKHYVNAGNYSFHIGFGASEPSHYDMTAYQPVLVVNPNHWVLKGERDSARTVFQDAGDLVLLDQGIKHHVVWERHFPKPTEPWMYLFIDLYNREKWLKRRVTRHQAELMVSEAIAALDCDTIWRWLNGKKHSQVT